MSIAMMKACRPLRMPPTAKAVLMALADRADDVGNAWPSIVTITNDTCFGRSAVIAALQWLEMSALIAANRSNGRHTTYRLTPEVFDQSATQTGPRRKPVCQTNQTGSADERDPSTTRTGPVRQTDTNPKEPTRTHMEPTVSAREANGLDRFVDFWAAWPKRIAKAAAEKAWQKGSCDQVADQIIAVVRERAARDAQWLREDGRFIPHAATFLNGKRWHDQWSAATTPASGRPSMRDSIAEKAFQGDHDDVVDEILA